MDDKGKFKTKDITMKDGEKVRLVEIPYVKPTVYGTMVPVIYAFLTFTALISLWLPQYALMYAIGNGVASLLWFTLYRVASTAAVSYINRCNMLTAVYQQEYKKMDAYIAEIAKKTDGTKSEDECLKTKQNEQSTSTTEPEK